MAEEKKLFGMPAEKGRWMLVFFGFLINLCLGSVYNYGLIRNSVETEFGVKALMSLLPNGIALGFFAGIFPFSGRILERIGPRKLGIIGGIVLGAGWIGAHFSGNIATFILTYGVIAGCGVGLCYSGPIAVAGRWFPERKGLAVGLTVAGFGGSPVVGAQIIKRLLGSYGLLDTVLYLGIAFLVLTVLFAFFLEFPRPGWKPAGWNPPPAAAASSSVSYNSSAMVKTASFWGLFLCFAIGSLAGLMVINMAGTLATKPLLRDGVAVLYAAGTATILTQIFGLFNGGGRPLFGFITDRVGARKAAMATFVIILLASVGMLSMVWTKHLNGGVYIASIGALWLSLGGWLAIAPATTTAYFGAQYSARNYGIMLLAYGVGAVAGVFIAGYAKDIFGLYLYAFYPTAVLAVVGFIMAWFLLKPPKKTEAPQK